MAKQYTCDICGDILDQVSAIQDRQGYVYILQAGTNIDVDIKLEITNPAISSTDICFNCIIENMQKTIIKRKEVIRANQKK